jgi:flagellar motility protein MotE (MotC chaperone)
MSPKAAAKLISSMDDSLAVSVMFQMDTQRLAKILNLVEPKKSTELSEKLVGLSKNQDLHSIRSLANQGVKADKNEKTKGGE